MPHQWLPDIAKAVNVATVGSVSVAVFGGMGVCDGVHVVGARVRHKKRTISSLAREVPKPKSAGCDSPTNTLVVRPADRLVGPLRPIRRHIRINITAQSPPSRRSLRPEEKSGYLFTGKSQRTTELGSANPTGDPLLNRPPNRMIRPMINRHIPKSVTTPGSTTTSTRIKRPAQESDHLITSQGLAHTKRGKL